MSGQLPLMPKIKQVLDEVMAGPSFGDGDDGALAAERALVGNLKKIGLFVSGAASQKYMAGLADQQEVMGAMADMLIEGYMAESALLRTRKIVEKQGESAATLPIAMTQVYLTTAMERIESAAKRVIAAVAEGDMLRTQMAILRRLAKYEPFNTIGLRQQIATRVIDTGKYVTA
jgi:butyryl-CoA dehydrogenase